MNIYAFSKHDSHLYSVHGDGPANQSDNGTRTVQLTDIQKHSHALDFEVRKGYKFDISICGSYSLEVNDNSELLIIITKIEFYFFYEQFEGI